MCLISGKSSNNLAIYLLMHTLNQPFIIIDYVADYNYKYVPVEY